jgi:hypothetical protein
MTRRLTTEDIVERCNKVHNYRYDYSQMGLYKNAHIKMKVICPEHGVWSINISNHLYNKRGCPDCGDDKRSKANSSNTTEFIAKSKLLHGNLFDYSKVEYILTAQKVEIVCKIHGSFFQRPENHLQGKGCLQCCIDDRATFPIHSLEEFIKKANEIHPNRYNYTNSMFEGLSALINIECPDHGVFTQEASSHLRGSGCWRCAKKGTSKKEEAWLDQYDIPHQYRQFKIKVRGKNLKFDGFDPISNVVYEFYGDFWHGNPDVFNPNDINGCNHREYGDLYQETLKRAELIKNAGYKLIEIWEHDYDTIMKERESKDDC